MSGLIVIYLLSLILRNQCQRLTAYSSYNDQQLFALLQQDDESAFRELYERYWNKLLAQAFIKLKSTQEAEEIIQEVFLQLWRRRKKTTLKNTFHTYIAAAVNYEIFAKIARLEKETISRQQLLAALPVQENTTIEQSNYEMLREKIEKTVQLLPEKCRLVFRLSLDTCLLSRGPHPTCLYPCSCALLEADGAVTFTSGIVTASDNTKPFTFTSTATVTGASNASHVSGFVVKKGTGNFIYPTGDGSRYQPVAVNPSANTDGIRARYNVANAGTGTFTGGTPLLYYNSLEHWDLTPISTATATVTIYWDDYNNIGIGNTADLRVAHKSGGNWLNEGVASVSGTTASGSVTSNSISSWSPFSLGSVNASSTLPLTWLSLTGNLNAQKQALINWSVREQNVRNYTIEKSGDGRSFTNIAMLNSQGNGVNDYDYQGQDVLLNTHYYRIKQTDLDGKFTYSSVLKLFAQQHTGLSVYPTPFRESFTVVSSAKQTARITTTDGKLIKTIQLKQGTNYVEAGGLQKGIYILAAENNAAQKIIKD